MKKNLLLVAICSLSLLGACSEPPATDTALSNAATDDATGIQATIDEARAKYMEAQQQQHAWTSTADLLQSATAALANGDMQSAKADSQRALLTANASLAQAKKQQSTWRNNIPG